MTHHFTPDCVSNETVPPASNEQFLKYKLNGIQFLMYVLFIPTVWFTFHYNFMHYSQFFQELYWVLALSVSLCPNYATWFVAIEDLNLLRKKNKSCHFLSLLYFSVYFRFFSLIFKKIPKVIPNSVQLLF